MSLFPAEEKKKELDKRKLAWGMLWIIIALCSVFIISAVVTAPSFHEGTMKTLDDKKTAVMNLAAVSAATSTALSVLPGDIATPVANQIAELSFYFIVVLSAIVLEKMLLAVVGYVTFTLMIPAACLFGILYLGTGKKQLKSLAIKLAIFGMILFFAIPISVEISDRIDSSHQYSVAKTIELAEQNQEYIEGKKEDFSTEDKNWFEKAGEYISNVASSIGTGLAEMTKKAEDTLGAMIDAVSILIVTCCIMPVLTLLVFAILIKALFGIAVNLLGLEEETARVGKGFKKVMIKGKKRVREMPKAIQDKIYKK